jgi:hypothetical protein
MKFSLSGFDDLNFQIVREMENNSFLFNEGIEIDNFFGTFNNIPWNGGRIDVGVPTRLSEVETFVKRVNDLGIGVRFTFSNLLLEKKHLGDYYANEVCEIAHNEMNSITIGSDILREYMRKTYPKYKLVSSITRVNRDINWTKEQLELFDYVVLPIEYNRKLKLIDSLPHKEKIEILVNESCVPFCKIKSQHYIASSRDNLSLSGYNDGLEYGECPMNDPNIENTKVLTWEEILELNNIGIENFKFLGRKLLFLHRYQDILNTFIKPEHRQEVFDISVFTDENT